ncbi:MAG: hypothetical protein O3A46_09790, partial [Candidatus Poribacteria bacterium]|nr:hypothetical protein [Candidatus Poribacteria bacterium]
RDMELVTKEGKRISVVPAPWKTERNSNTSVAEFGGHSLDGGDDHDLGRVGLLSYENNALDTAGAQFGLGAVRTGAFGFFAVAGGPIAVPVLFAGVAGNAADIATGGGPGSNYVQYEVSPSRMFRTPSEDEIDDLPDKMGPGKGDLYYGEGWTIGLQTRYRLKIVFDPTSQTWIPATNVVLTYDILDRSNQYLYNPPTSKILSLVSTTN